VEATDENFYAVSDPLEVVNLLCDCELKMGYRKREAAEAVLPPHMLS